MEACDNGALNSDTSACTLSCKKAICGDGLLHNTGNGDELCDLGAGNGPGKECNAQCKPNTCGDGDKSPSEACDDGNQSNDDACTNV